MVSRYCFSIPVFFFEGTEDFVTPIEPAYAYFEQAKAPRKEFVLFKGGDHFIALDRPDEFLTQLIEYIRPLVFSAKDEPIEPTIRAGARLPGMAPD
jgi:hypothetical protein